MIESDTIKLLRECDAGIKMGISSIDDVLSKVKNKSLYSMLNECKREHQGLERETTRLLHRYNDDGKKPNPIAKSMSKMKTNMMLAIKRSDATVSDLMTDGCNMGVKSLSRYLNKYEAADESSKDIAKRLISSEENLAVKMRGFL